MGSHHGGDVGWQSELRLVAMEDLGSGTAISRVATQMSEPSKRWRTRGRKLGYLSGGKVEVEKKLWGPF